ncbi:MAG: HI0074 family nucleotidyltransferase substrate-binding subunit [Eubacteriales bacterium]|nr:HI0074 family nucleotidyltransferase substrate-binding subunit [Eubacteriales bacterium]
MEFRFENRYRSFCDSFAALSEAPDRDRNDSFVLSGTSAKFCITFELAWKLMKDILVEYYGVNDFTAGSPRETLRAAFRIGLISDDKWIEMMKLRNLLAHDYDLSVVTDAFDVICTQYLPLFASVKEKVELLLRNES